MEKLKIKYAPMIIVIYFSVMGLLIAVILSALDDFFGGSPFLKKLTSLCVYIYFSYSNWFDLL